MLENTRQNNHIDYVFQEYDYVWFMSEVAELEQKWNPGPDY